MKKKRINIFDYTDFRIFIRDYLDLKKKESYRLSRRYYCERLSLKSPSYLKLIIDGRRTLTETLMHKIALVFELNKGESRFFFDLVEYNQTGSESEKVEAFQKLRRHKNFIKIHKMSLDNFDFMTDPITLALKEMVVFDDFREDYAWIVSRMSFPAKEIDVQRGLVKLIDLGLIRRDKAGSLVPTFKQTKTGDQFGNISLRTYHSKMLEKAGESIELPIEQRYFRGYTMSISPEAYSKIIDEYDMFFSKVRRIVNEDKTPDSVYHTELAMFPLTKPNERD